VKAETPALKARLNFTQASAVMKRAFRTPVWVDQISWNDAAS
jgi:hypothetical protein